MRSYLLLILISHSLAYPASAQQIKVPITIAEDIYQYAQEIIAEQKAWEVEDFSGPNSQREAIEFILLQKALTLGGSKLDFSFTTGNYNANKIKLLQSGLLLISFDSMWYSQILPLAKDLYISDPVIRKGEFWAGIYTATDNKKALSTTTIDDFKKLSVISNKNWHVDWQTLSQMTPNKLIHDEEWLSMAKLVSLKWVDVMLAPFTPEKPFSYQGKEYKIVAIDGVKIALNDSRHFIVSKKHPHSEETFKALQKGLKILRQRGTIVKAFTQSGLFNKELRTWHVLNDAFIKAETVSKND